MGEERDDELIQVKARIEELLKVRYWPGFNEAEEVEHVTLFQRELELLNKVRPEA